MDKRVPITDLNKPEQLETLKGALSEMAEDLDVLVTTTAPNGNISGRAGRIALYNNSGIYTIWICIDATTWQQIGAGSFVDRGDPSSVDFSASNLTEDDTWRDLDLSAVVPAGAKAVFLRVHLQDNAVGEQIMFRKNGNSNSKNISKCIIQIADLEIYYDVIVACDTNRVIEYNATAGLSTTTFETITVGGWWL